MTKKRGAKKKKTWFYCGELDPTTIANCTPDNFFIFSAQIFLSLCGPIALQID
jgi:hypothetical protein